jgi:hypothetical protein
VEERMRTDAVKSLNEHLGPNWGASSTQRCDTLDELAACSLALGLSA